MIIKCPTNCEHDLPFSHSFIESSRVVKGIRTTYLTIVCRHCEHWITRRGPCDCVCHTDTEAPNYQAVEVSTIPV